jgi:hypothetical protein
VYLCSGCLFFVIAEVLITFGKAAKKQSRKKINGLLHVESAVAYNQYRVGEEKSCLMFVVTIIIVFKCFLKVVFRAKALMF